MVLYCRPHSQVVHVPVWSSQNSRGAPEGGIVENSHPPLSSHKIGSGKLVRDKKNSSRQTECIGVILKDV